MTWLALSFAALVVIAIAAARLMVCKAKAVARDQSRFELARTIDADPSEYSAFWEAR